MKISKKGVEDIYSGKRNNSNPEGHFITFTKTPHVIYDWKAM